MRLIIALIKWLMRLLLMMKIAKLVIEAVVKLVDLSLMVIVFVVGHSKSFIFAIYFFLKDLD